MAARKMAMMNSMSARKREQGKNISEGISGEGLSKNRDKKRNFCQVN